MSSEENNGVSVQETEEKKELNYSCINVFVPSEGYRAHIKKVIPLG